MIYNINYLSKVTQLNLTQSKKAPSEGGGGVRNREEYPLPKFCYIPSRGSIDRVCAYTVGVEAMIIYSGGEMW